MNHIRILGKKPEHEFEPGAFGNVPVMRLWVIWKCSGYAVVGYGFPLMAALLYPSG